ncbi:TetR/AcrR family transcriptional regulator [Devriesea agamarum]|uniref:TetR/AcrR family transcriptional regulator n=1 Tax=Devriesea agamarum TaxID=472569 RepID=UPI00071D4A51|nr:TetR/AcrR family transcriptional regulator [Devriesea agamarum]
MNSPRKTPRGAHVDPHQGDHTGPHPTPLPDAIHATCCDDPILDAAGHLFYERGIASVSIQDIRARANISLKALYRRYPSKDTLVLAYLSRTHSRWMDDVQAATADSATPEEAIDRLFAWLRSWFCAPNYLGCGIANTRGAALSPEARAIVRRHLRELQELLINIVDDQTAGEALFVLVEGAIAASTGTGNPDYADRAHRAARALLSTRPH